MQSNRYTIVVAAGSGRRMGAVLPKQFLVVAGKPILMHTLHRLHTFDRSMSLLLVLHPDHIGKSSSRRLPLMFHIQLSVEVKSVSIL